MRSSGLRSRSWAAPWAPTSIAPMRRPIGATPDRRPRRRALPTARRSASSRARRSPRTGGVSSLCGARRRRQQALAENPGLDAAEATLRESQDSLRAGYGVFFPQLDARAGANRQLYNPAPGRSAEQHIQPVLPLGDGELFPRHLGRLPSSGRGPGCGGRSAALCARRGAGDADEQRRQRRHRAGRVPGEIEATTRHPGAAPRAGAHRERPGDGRDRPLLHVLTLQSQVASTEATIPPLEEKIDQAADLSPRSPAPRPRAGSSRR